MGTLTFNSLSSKALGGKSGVYKLSAGGHIYVGSSKNLYARLAEHRSDLYYRRHSNQFLQRVCNKEGIENFNIEILEFCPPDKRIEREKYWIGTLHADMNMQDPISHALSEESKEKLSNSIKAGIKAGRYKKKYDFAKIECYDYFGNLLKVYNTIEEICKELNVTDKAVHRCLSSYGKGGYGTTIKGYRFRYSCSRVPVHEFSLNSKYIGKYFEFMFKNPETGELSKAFDTIKDCWTFFRKHYLDKEIIIIPRPKLRESGNSLTDYAEANPKPSSAEMQKRLNDQ